MTLTLMTFLALLGTSGCYVNLNCSQLNHKFNYQYTQTVFVAKTENILTHVLQYKYFTNGGGVAVKYKLKLIRLSITSASVSSLDH